MPDGKRRGKSYDAESSEEDRRRRDRRRRDDEKSSNTERPAIPRESRNDSSYSKRQDERARQRDRSSSREVKRRKTSHSRERRRDEPSNRPDHRQQKRRSRSRSRSRSPYRSNRRRDGSREDRYRKPNPSSRHRKSKSRSPPPFRRSKAPLPPQNTSYAISKANEEGLEPPIEKQKPNFGSTGVLAAETNKVSSHSTGTTVVLKYHEPPEARKPPPAAAWRLYIFKGSEIVETLQLASRSCWLFGREELVADCRIEHPSASKQHAVIQFRYTTKEKGKNEWGEAKMEGKVRPYIIDLESANGTKLNGEEIAKGRYLELRDKDVLQFGFSSREYVLVLPPKE